MACPTLDINPELLCAVGENFEVNLHDSQVDYGKTIIVEVIDLLKSRASAKSGFL